MDIETLFGGTMALTIGFVTLSLACTCVIVAAGIGLPLLYYRNRRQKVETLMATGTQGEAPFWPSKTPACASTTTRA